MDDWRIKDYKTRCYNLQNQITPYKADMITIEKTAKAIRKKNKCDELTALRILKKQLEEKLAKKSRK
jgi:hypothetical protein